MSDSKVSDALLPAWLWPVFCPRSLIPSRCKQPNVDQITGAKHPLEPFKAMRTHRNVDEGAPLKGCMGMEMTPLFSGTDTPAIMETILIVGMSLEVIERGLHWYIDS